MKRYLLSMMLCALACVGAKAYVIDESFSDGSKAKFSDDGVDIQKVEVTAGGLAAWLEWYNQQGTANQTLGANSARNKLVITGTLNAEDLAVLSSDKVSGFSTFVQIDMDGVTLAEGTSTSDLLSMKLPKAEYIALPYNTEITVMQSMHATNTSLKAVACNSAADGTEFTGYSWAKGEIYNICQLGIVDGITAGVAANTISKLTVGGYVIDKDVSTVSQNTNWSFKNASGWNYQVDNVNKACANEYITPTSGESQCSPWAGDKTKIIDLSEALFSNWGDLATVSTAVTNLTLPNDKNFTKIYAYMFANLYYLEEIVVPNNVVTIGDAAFSVNNKNDVATNVTIGNGIKTIGNTAFGGRHALTDFVFSAGISDVKILSSVFSGCTGIKHMTLPEGVTTLGEAAFKQLGDLESIHFPSTLTYIGKYCFQQTGLTSVTIPSSVKIIDKGAFGNCRINDIYLMAESVDQLPYIYANAYGVLSNEDNATFGSNTISANNSSPNNTEKSNFAGYTTEEADVAFRSCTEQNCIACLHFSEAVRSFIDYNPWYIEGEAIAKEATEAVGDQGIYEQLYMSDTYYLVDSEGKTYPCKNADDSARDNYSAYYDSSKTHHWGDTPDYPTESGKDKQPAYYNATTGELIAFTEVKDYIYDVLRKEGWRQFIYKLGDAADDNVVFTKEYDNVWYTMCFPFGLTDEQLESAFNANYNIADFSGVEIKTDDETNAKTLVLHFNKIAIAKYYDQNYKQYTREGGKTSTTVGSVTFNTYTYKDEEGNTYSYITSFSNKSYAKNGDKNNGIVYIDGYLAEPGHPYMIHPNFGTKKGDNASTAHMTGLNYYSQNPTVITELCAKKARAIDLNKDGGYIGDARTAAVSTLTATSENFDQKAQGSKYDGQTYTFIGNCYDYDASSVTTPKPTKGAYPAYTGPSEPTEPTKPDMAGKPALDEFEQNNKPTEVEKPETEVTDLFRVVYTANYESFFKNWDGSDYSSWDQSCYLWASKYENFYNNKESVFNDHKTQFAAMAAWKAYEDYLVAYEKYIAEYNALKADWEYNEEAAQAEYAAAKAAYEAAMKEWQDACDKVDADYEKELAAWEAGLKKIFIPKDAYFLSRHSREEYYTHFFRETGTTGPWNQYTAILVPNSAAVSGIEKEIDTKTATSKGFSMAFDEDWIAVTPTEIEEIVADAEEQGVPVQFMNVVISIDGKVVRRGDLSLEGLPRGMYIVNGKKYFVK